jgi:hypothetical protein
LGAMGRNRARIWLALTAMSSGCTMAIGEGDAVEWTEGTALVAGGVPG